MIINLRTRKCHEFFCQELRGNRQQHLMMLNVAYKNLKR